MTLPNEPRSVKPRKASARAWLPLIVVSRTERIVFCEMTGSVHGWNELAMIVRSHPASIVVAPNASHMLADLNVIYSEDPMWQYRVSPIKRERYNVDPTVKVRSTVDTVVNYFGWKGSSYTRPNGKQANRKGHWHYPLDPNLFTQGTALDILDSADVAGYLAWGKDLREWCAANELHPTPTAGGLGGQLLRDARFYPEPRRKVPRATNANARAALPGNYYKLLWPEGKSVDATYIDMSSSHHQAAASVHFPSSNYLFARGEFHTTDKAGTPDEPNALWAPRGSRRFDHLITGYGLLKIQLNVPQLRPDQFPPPYMEKPGRRVCWVYTNELPLIASLRGDIEGIIAAWTSFDRDEGLNAYAAWALAETATVTRSRKRWLKTALLATYGNLAARPRVSEYAYRTAADGVAKEYPAGPHLIPVMANVGDMEQEIPTVNVIHRGMIEAEQRRVVLDMARDLTGWGHVVIAIYADAIMVKSGGTLPMLPAPWRIEAELTRLKFLTPTAFTSDEMTKLPGIPRQSLEKLERIARMRRKSATI